MTDLRDDGDGVGEAAEAGGLLPFLRQALAGIFTRSQLIPALLLLVVLTGSNIGILLNLPADPGRPSGAFLLWAFIRVAGLLILTVAILRIATLSERGPWRPDGAFWLHALVLLASFGIVAAIALLGSERNNAAGVLANNALSTALLAPFAPWVVATAVAVPLAVRPGRYMRAFGRWLPPLLLWSLLLVTPLAVLHASIDMRLIAGAGESFWPLALVDGAISTLMAMIGFGLNAEAYRRVAQG